MSDYDEEMTEKMSPEDKKRYGDYRTKCKAECDARTLIEYGEVKADKERMKRAQMALDDKMKALKLAKDA